MYTHTGQHGRMNDSLPCCKQDNEKHQCPDTCKMRPGQIGTLLMYLQHKLGSVEYVKETVIMNLCIGHPRMS